MNRKDTFGHLIYYETLSLKTFMISFIIYLRQNMEL